MVSGSFSRKFDRVALRTPLRAAKTNENEGIPHSVSEELLREILRNANRGDLFMKILQEAREKGTLLQIHANPHDLEQPVIGLVRSLGDETCIVQELDWEGLPDGLTTVSIRQIRQIMQNTRHLCRIAWLQQQQLPTQVVLEEEEFAEDPLDCMISELETARDTGQLVNCRIASESDFIQALGFVHDIVDEYVQLNLLTIWGEPDGVATVRLQDIVGIYRNDRQQSVAYRLYQHRKDLYTQAEWNMPESDFSQD